MKLMISFLVTIFISNSSFAAFYLYEDKSCQAYAAQVALRNLSTAHPCVEGSLSKSDYVDYPPLGNMKYYRGVDLECYFEGSVYARVNWNACTFNFSGKVDPNNNDKPIDVEIKKFVNAKAGWL